MSAPLPAPVDRLYSFTAFQQGQGDNSFPGTQLDTDLDQTNNALAAVIEALRAVLRPDGKLANGSVTRAAFAADVRLGLGASRPWGANRAYARDDTVTSGYGLYVCVVAHMSSTLFLTDLTEGRWELLADLSQAVTLAPGSIDTAAYIARSVTEPKLADGAASGRVIADGALVPRHADVSFGTVPVGGEMDFGGVLPPAGWLFCAGQAVSRAIYVRLFEALSTIVAATTTSGQTTLTAVGADLTALGLLDAFVEGPGVQPGSRVVALTANSITLSQPATASASGVGVRLLPWGRGDGSTTFNVPDRRGRVTVGRDNMGGPAAGRLASWLQATRLNATGGSDGEILTLAHLPVALPGGSVSVSYPSHTYVSPDSTINIQYGDAGTIATVNNLCIRVKAAQTLPPDPVNIPFSISNPGGGQAHSTLQPSGVANRIIFAGA